MQTIIVILIIAGVLFFGVRKTLRMIKGKDKPCNCGNNDCQCCKSKPQA